VLRGKGKWMTCIYCPSEGPFSDEHVIPAGLGGDDVHWLLKDCVCRVCNTEIFSKLETKFLRISPMAIARLFVQPQTRSGTPSVQPTITYHHDARSGLLLEAELGPGGAPKILPQLIVQSAYEVAIKPGLAQQAVSRCIPLSSSGCWSCRCLAVVTGSPPTTPRRQRRAPAGL